MPLLSTRRRPAAPISKVDHALDRIMVLAEKMIGAAKREIAFHQAELDANPLHEGDDSAPFGRLVVWQAIQTKSVGEFYGETVVERWTSSREVLEHVRAEAAKDERHPAIVHAWNRALHHLESIAGE